MMFNDNKNLIPLSGLRGDGLFAIVDLTDYCWLAGMGSWHLDRGYACKSIKKKGVIKKLQMHREIIKKYYNNLQGDQYVDHINGNRLDNRKTNLRIITSKQNVYNKRKQKNNTSGFKGIHKTENGKWRVVIGYNHKQIYLGRFSSKKDAALAYDLAAIELFGEFLYFKLLNFPELFNQYYKYKSSIAGKRLLSKLEGKH